MHRVCLFGGAMVVIALFVEAMQTQLQGVLVVIAKADGNALITIARPKRMARSNKVVRTRRVARRPPTINTNATRRRRLVV